MIDEHYKERDRTIATIVVGNHFQIRGISDNLLCGQMETLKVFDLIDLMGESECFSLHGVNIDRHHRIKNEPVTIHVTPKGWRLIEFTKELLNV